MKRSLLIPLLGAATVLVLAVTHLYTIWSAPTSQEQAAALQIALPQRLYEQIIHSDDILAQIEAEIGCPLEFIPWQSDDELDSLSGICSSQDFNGIIFFNDPLSIIPLSEQGMLSELTDLTDSLFPHDDEEQFSARYQGIQYGIVYSERQQQTVPPLLAYRPDILSQYDYSGFPDNSDGCWELMLEMKQDGLIPFAVYGTPFTPGFSAMLALYGLHCTGNGEFAWEGQRIVYDPVSEQTAEYLQFLSSLYQEGLIPSDFLTLDLFSVFDLFLNGETPFCIVPTSSDAALLKSLCDSRSVPVEFEEVSGGLDYENEPYGQERNLLAISSRAETWEPIAAFCKLLIEDDGVRELFSPAPTAMEQYLCERYGTDQGINQWDPVYRLPVNLRLMKIKQNLEEEILNPYFSKMVVGAYPVSEFEKVTALWEESGGENLLEMLTRYCT